MQTMLRMKMLVKQLLMLGMLMRPLMLMMLVKHHSAGAQRLNRLLPKLGGLRLLRRTEEETGSVSKRFQDCGIGI